MGSLEQAVYAIIISFVIGVILCPIVIPMLRKLKFGQNVRDDGPQTHLAKRFSIRRNVFSSSVNSAIKIS